MSVCVIFFVLTKVAGTKVGTVSKYPTVLVYDRTRKYTPRNMTPSKQDMPPQIRHQITYFRRPVLCAAVEEMKIKVNNRLRLGQ